MASQVLELLSRARASLTAAEQVALHEQLVERGLAPALAAGGRGAGGAAYDTGVQLGWELLQGCAKMQLLVVPRLGGRRALPWLAT